MRLYRTYTYYVCAVSPTLENYNSIGSEFRKLAKFEHSWQHCKYYVKLPSQEEVNFIIRGAVNQCSLPYFSTQNLFHAPSNFGST